MPGLRGSLRSRLILACLGVELAAAALALAFGAQQLQRTLHAQAAQQASQVVALLNHALAAPLAQRDYATVQQTLDLAREGGGIDYLVLQDHRGRPVAAAGWNTAQPLPPRDGDAIDLERADTTLHLRGEISVADQRLGLLDLGLTTLPWRLARSEFIAHSVAVSLVAVLVSLALLAAIALALTRRLARLDDASRRVARGDFDIVLPVEPADELGRLGASFNAMAATVKQRVQALQASEERQREHLQVVRDERSRLTTLLAAMKSGILFVDAEGMVVYCNEGFAQLWRLGAPAAGRPVRELVPVLAQLLQPESRAAIQALAQGQADDSADVELRTLDERLVVQRHQPVAGGGCIWLHQDITLDRHTQQRARQATQDPLTRLPNRRGLFEALQAALDQAARDGQSLALMFIDLDDFKLANDLGGHRAGDELLVSVATALGSQLRRGEIVARLGGDEFAVLCPGLAPAEAGAVAERLVRAVGAASVQAAAQTLRVSCSIGIAHYPRDAHTEDELVACADTAMYQAKHEGKGHWASYRADAARRHAESARVDWNDRIRAALQHGRFVLHFQPVWRAHEPVIAYHEALLRMVDENDPARLLAPASFVPHAERSGRIRQIDRWVFAACVEHLAAAPPEVALAANLSARSLEDPDFAPFLAEQLQRRDVDPRRLHVELTETSAIADPLAARQLITQLRALGCRVHLDDFGAGFNSFAQLKLLDVDAIKIDGSFIRDLDADPGNRMFVGAMVGIARNLNKLTVAEHVENEATLQILLGLGIDLVQGFHLGRPAATLARPESRERLRLVRDFRRSGAAPLAG